MPTGVSLFVWLPEERARWVEMRAKRDLLHLADGGPASCDEARMMARTSIADLQQRIDELVGMRDALTQLVDTCDHPRAERDCPILHDIGTAANTTTPHPEVTVMRIELLTSPGCPNADTIRKTLTDCLTSLGIDDPIIDRVGRYPSPTVLIDGVDVMRPAAKAQPGDACRLDLPAPQDILDALRPRGPQQVQSTSHPTE
ncbi:MAG: hypothetical protein QOF31_104 [Mycobacterium sp.]|jgi:hypothetical protein|nr:hypothetical protein [Mycobacterium sp.]